MANNSRMSPQQAISLKERGMTHAEIAELAGLTVSGVQQMLSRAGYTKRYDSHKSAVPWTVAKKHAAATVYTYLRNLDILAKGKKIRESENEHKYQANTAISWANELLDSHKDVDYKEDKPPSDFSTVGGFFTKEADEENWHLRNLMQRVITAQTRKL